MTERSPEQFRLDLRLLDAGDDPGRQEAVIQAVLARLTTTDEADRMRWTTMARVQRVLVAVAALWLLAAGLVVFGDRGGTAGTNVTAVVETWARSSHVPTNAELLVAFKGYHR